MEGANMRFLLKLMVLGFVGLMLLPSFVPTDNTGGDEAWRAADPVSPTQVAWSAATIAHGVADDVRGLCERDQQICAHGAMLAGMAIERARHGARIALSMVEDRRDAQRDADATTTGSIQHND